MTVATPAGHETVINRMAARVADFSAADLTRAAIRQSKACLIDAIGVTLAGVKEPCTRILLETPGVADAPGPCLVFGASRRTSALDATLINGVASHALDYDDFSGDMGGHHTVPLMPLLFALAEERKAAGRAILAAYAIGVEVEIRLSRAVNQHHYDKGWHPTSTLGVFGAAAAASHLLGLGKDKTAQALAIAASHAMGLKANFGTMTKPLHVGQCGRNGLLAALLAANGFTAASDVMEHSQGFFNVFNGPGTFDAERIFAGWAAPLEIESPTIGLKQYPCCGSTHAAVFAMVQLRDEYNLRPDQIRHILIRPHARRLRHTNTPHPRTALEAKFSVQYCCARALKDGVLRLRHFEDDACLDPAIVRLLAVTTAEPHPAMADDAAQQWAAEVTVELNDGKTISRRIDNMTGRGGSNPMSSDEMWEKFDDCAERALPREQVAPLFECLETLDTMTDIGRVTKLMEVSPLHVPPPARIVLAPAGTETAPETTWVP